MRNPRRRGRSNGTRLTLVLLGVFSCFGGAAFALTRTEQPAPPAAPAPVVTQATIKVSSRALSIRVTPRTRSVAPGVTARYKIRIRRHKGRRVKLTILGRRPPGTRARFNPKRKTCRRRATLRVTTAGTPSGRYRIRLLARSGKRRAKATIYLVVRSPKPVEPGPPASPPPTNPGSPSPSRPAPTNFTIRGNLSRPLSPGVSVPLDLALSNPGAVEITISRLGVAVSRVGAARCSAQDFSVTPFSGAYGFKLPPASTRTLSQLGFRPEQWPRVAMLNRPINQDGCKGASLGFTYTGTATA